MVKMKEIIIHKFNIKNRKNLFLKIGKSNLLKYKGAKVYIAV